MKILFLMIMLGGLGFAGGGAGSPAAEEILEMEEIVVTPLRAETEVREVPASVTVIDRAEIERGVGSTPADLLRGRPGVVVRDSSGNGNNVTVDLRGFGEFAAVNTLLLIDGRRTNAPDLSGADFSQVPLERIERIEIIRGGGSVLYGDNAAGGVINIITRPGRGKPRWWAEADGGSFGERRLALGGEGGVGEVDYSAQLSNRALDGWRENSDLWELDGGGRIDFQPAGNVNLKWDGHYHRARYGLPGALRESDLEIHGREYSRYPDDRMKVEDWYQVIGGRAELGPAELRMDLSFRRRDTERDLRSSYYQDRADLETFGLNPGAEVDLDLAGLEHSLSGGVDIYTADSDQDSRSFYGWNYYQGDTVRKTAIGKDTFGIYLQDRVNWEDLLILTAGWRKEWAWYDFSSHPRPGPWEDDPYWWPASIDDSLRVSREAGRAGLTVLAAEEFSCFVNASRGFRFPSTDEYYSIWAVPPINQDLQPQTWYNWELGFDLRPLPGLFWSVSVFQMDLRNELYYDPLTYSNRNYDRTRRRGLESGLRWQLSPELSMGIDCTLLSAYFRGGEYDGNRVPMVPSGTARLEINWSPLDGLEAVAAGNYVGPQRFINDQANSFPSLDDYITVDLKLFYRMEDLRLFAGVDNIFDREYSELGAIASFPEERAYYPAPGRSFFGGAEFSF